MNPWLDRLVRGFSFRIQVSVLRYLVVCAGALAGAMLGAFISGGDVTFVVIGGGLAFIFGRAFLWIWYRE